MRIRTLRSRILRRAMPLALVAVTGVTAAAADEVIYNGIDLFVTPGDGGTYVSFAADPLPAGFFCPGSAPFTGKIVLQGLPLVTERGALGPTDMIVQRLDDAVFDRTGVARTRIQVRAFTLASVRPIAMACGSFAVKVSLAGEQPVTSMRIVRDLPEGGTFQASIALRVKLAFQRTEAPAVESLEVVRNIKLDVNRSAVWSTRAGADAVRNDGIVLVDTDGNGVTDTYLPGTSNFAAGWRVRKVGGAVEKSESELVDHVPPPTGSHLHSVYPATFTLPERRPLSRSTFPERSR